MKLTLPKWPWYTQVGAFVGLSLAALGAFYYVYASPAETEIAARRDTLDRLRADINRGLMTARKLPQFRAEAEQLEGRLQSLKAVLPEEKDVADLLRRLQTLAMQSNLTIRGFKPAPILARPLHAEWPIGLELDGTYHNLGLFFDRISKLSRIINVSGIAIKAKDKPDESSTITAECVATTFVLIEAPAKGATAPPVAPKGM